MKKTIIGIVGACWITSAGIQSTLWVSPTGSGAAFSSQSPGSLYDVRAKVRTFNAGQTGDIVVNLKGGTYALDSAFVLRTADGGSNGYRVIYQAAAGETPVVSGGRSLSGWSLFDNTKNIWRANAGVSLRTRQLYVAGKRAQRARGPDDPSGFTKTATGYTTTDTSLRHFANIADMEIVGYTDWKCYRCGIASISGNAITMKEPCWTNTQAHAGWPMNNPKWIENAYELLDAPGEWYLDRSAGYLYYKPRSGEIMTSVDAVVAVAETLLIAQGTISTPVSSVDFRGITFSHGTWLKPNTNRGFPEMQATYQWGNEGKAPANVIMVATHNVNFDRCVFTHLGGAGLSFEEGSSDNSVTGCLFSDISANGIHIGAVDADPAAGAEVRQNIISNNYITAIGAEYTSAVGIFVGYTDSTVIAHNEIVNLPYTGISCGWGWSNSNNAAKNNKIHHNLIKNVMLTLIDGGAIYTLSAQHGTEVSYNYIQNVGSNNGLYPDEGSSYMQWHHNVVSQAPRWLHMWTGTVSQDTVENNWHDTQNQLTNGTNCVVRNNPLISGGAWPQEALDVMAGAGLEAAYQDIRPTSVTGPALHGAAATFPIYTMRTRGAMLDVRVYMDAPMRSIQLIDASGRTSARQSGAGELRIAESRLGAGIRFFLARDAGGRMAALPLLVW